MFWKKIAGLLPKTLPGTLKQTLLASALKASGVAGGVWSFVAGILFNIAYSFARKEIGQKAVAEDLKIVDDINNKQYQTDLENGATLEQKIKDETAVLNGGPLK